MYIHMYVFLHIHIFTSVFATLTGFYQVITNFPSGNAYKQFTKKCTAK